MNFSLTQEPVIYTPRLELHHICANELFTLFETPESDSIYIGHTYSNPFRVLVDDKGPLPWRVPQVRENESVNKWFVRWIVLAETREIIGSISFHGAPDQQGMIEIGLGLEEPFRNRGFGYESLLGMWQWVLTQPHVQMLRYTVSPDNAPSIALIKKFGFVRVGQQMDEVDGPEDIFEMSASEFRRDNPAT